MDKYAIIEAGVVVNIIIADASFAESVGAVRTDTAGIGWSYANGVFSAQPAPQPTLADLKNARTNLVKSIVVTTSAGHAFDGDEDSQNRMARAIAGMDDTDTMLWVLSDNALITVNKTELREALRLSGIAMTTIWMAPYQAQ